MSWLVLMHSYLELREVSLEVSLLRMDIDYLPIMLVLGLFAAWLLLFSIVGLVRISSSVWSPPLYCR